MSIRNRLRYWLGITFYREEAQRLINELGATRAALDRAESALADARTETAATRGAVIHAMKFLRHVLDVACLDPARQVTITDEAIRSVLAKVDRLFARAASKKQAT